MEILKEILKEINQAKIDSIKGNVRTGDYRIGLTKAEQIINEKIKRTKANNKIIPERLSF